jgi:hypothetical protein
MSGFLIGRFSLSLALGFAALGLFTMGAAHAQSPVHIQAKTPSQVDKLPTLFFSPAERAAIQFSRSGQSVVNLNVSTALTVSGLVKRRADKGMVWINGTAMPEGSSTPAGVTPAIGKRSVRIEQNEVRVGETLDAESGERIDFIPPGSVHSRRP